MPLGKNELLSRILDAASGSGASVAFWGDPASHPFRVVFTVNGISQIFLIYVWNITHGGGSVRAADEYRIQITSVSSIEEIPGAATLIIGYYEAANVFAGWDSEKHIGPVASSPSLQVRESALLDANMNGVAIYAKSNDEVVICTKPQFFVEYAFTCKTMHRYVTPEIQAEYKAIVTAEPAADATSREVALVRGRDLQLQARLHRAYDFRRRVLAAYQNTCALSGTQLRLVDAAHILPVSVSGSHDGTPNRICMELTYHRAFDQWLLVLIPDYTIGVDISRVDMMTGLSLAGGYERFLAGLRVALELPGALSRLAER